MGPVETLHTAATCPQPTHLPLSEGKCPGSSPLLKGAGPRHLVRPWWSAENGEAPFVVRRWFISSGGWGPAETPPGQPGRQVPLLCLSWESPSPVSSLPEVSSHRGWCWLDSRTPCGAPAAVCTVILGTSTPFSPAAEEERAAQAGYVC